MTTKAKTNGTTRAATFGQVVHTPLAQIVSNPWQPRRMLDPDKVGELAESIMVHGLLQPPAGRIVDGGKGKGVQVQLVFGHYRVEAIRRLVAAGRWTGDVPMSILELDDAGMFMTALTENSARHDLSQLEEYQAYARALKEIEGLTIQALADSIGLNRSTLSNNLRILELPKVALHHVESGDMSPRAARELLAFKSKNHTHDREIDWVVEQVVTTHLGSAADWRTEHIRKLVRNALGRFDADWRPLEVREGDVAEYGGLNEGSGFAREPSFNVPDLLNDFPDDNHVLPRLDGKTRAWTCNVKEWRKRQSAATREANKAAGTTGPALATSESGRQREKQSNAALAKDPAVKAVRAELDKADRGTGGELSAAEREKLGVRGEPVRVFKYDEFHERLDALPDWWPDRAECLETCTIGAAYGSDYQGNPVRLFCTNQKNFNDKRSRGIAALRERLDAEREIADAQDRQLIEAAGASTDWPTLARVTARAILATVDFQTTAPAGFAFRPGYRDGTSTARLDYIPEVLALAFKTLDVKVKGDPFRDSMVDRQETLAALDKLADNQVVIVAAQLVTWCIRHTHTPEGFELAVEPFGLTKSEATEPEAAAPSYYYASLSAEHPTAHIIDGSKPLCGTEALAKSMVPRAAGDEGKVCARCSKVEARRAAEAVPA